MHLVGFWCVCVWWGPRFEGGAALRRFTFSVPSPKARSLLLLCSARRSRAPVRLRGHLALPAPISLPFSLSPVLCAFRKRAKNPRKEGERSRLSPTVSKRRRGVGSAAAAMRALLSAYFSRLPSTSPPSPGVRILLRCWCVFDSLCRLHRAGLVFSSR